MVLVGGQVVLAENKASVTRHVHEHLNKHHRQFGYYFLTVNRRDSYVSLCIGLKISMFPPCNQEAMINLYP